MRLIICDMCGKIIDMHGDGEKYKIKIGIQDRHLCENCEQAIIDQTLDKEKVLVAVEKSIKEIYEKPTKP